MRIECGANVFHREIVVPSPDWLMVLGPESGGIPGNVGFIGVKSSVGIIEAGLKQQATIRHLARAEGGGIANTYAPAIAGQSLFVRVISKAAGPNDKVTPKRSWKPDEWIDGKLVRDPRWATVGQPVVMPPVEYPVTVEVWGREALTLEDWRTAPPFTFEGFPREESH